MSICPLHNHSQFSSLDGLATADEIAQRCVDIGAEHCGLTDHGVVAGHLEFAKLLPQYNIKPVFGCELYHGLERGVKGKRDQAHVIALAMTDEGLRNLWRLTDGTARAESFHNVGRIFWEDLEKYREGLVVTSACALGLVPKAIMQDDYEALNRYLEIFKDDFYIEIHTYPYDKNFDDRDADGEPVNMRSINQALVAVAQERGVPLVYANDAHYAFPEQAAQHDMYLALQTGQNIYTPIEDRTMWHPPGALSIHDEDQVRDALAYLPASVVDEALDNSVVLGERANAQLPGVRRHMPTFIPGDGPFGTPASIRMSAEEWFMRHVVDGIFRRYGKAPSDEVWKRVEYEVETLINDGIHHYFLMGWDEIQFCDQEGIIRGPGRGSSAGCIVAYALGITDVDPLHYGLIFERFWNSGRADGFPDIDSDFSQARRHEVIEYLKDRWGHDKVQAIGTVGRMKPKATIDRLWKGCAMTLSEATELKAIVGGTRDIEIHGVDQIGWTRELEPGKVIYVEEEVGEEIHRWVGTSEKRQRFVEMCEATCSRVQLYGIHPSGVVISDVKLDDELPVYRRGGKLGIPATQFPMDDVDKLQFIKLDVLGLRTLDTIDQWDKLVAEKGIKVEWSGLDIKSHPDGLWDMLHDEYTAGIFQVESGYPKRLCGLMNARSVEDLAVIVALNRPGPIGDGVPDRYIARRSGEEQVSYIHPRLEELLGPNLAPTYGLFVYQEQVIRYFNDLGYTLSEADAVRKILGKKRPEALQALHDGVEEWEGRGYVEVAHAAGVPEKAAESTWQGLERFASYSFNKSHAVCYGVIGFRCLFAKYYGPAQFYAACLRTVDGDKRKEMMPPYVNEARRLGFEVYPPDIAKSQGAATVDDDGNVWLGFGDVKGVGESGDYMTELRDKFDYSTPETFYASFEVLNDEYLKQKKAYAKALTMGGEAEAPDPKSPKQKLGANKIAAIYQAGAWDSLVPTTIPIAEKQQLEEELLGVILTDFTKEAFEANAEEIAGCDTYADVKRPWDEKTWDAAATAEVDADAEFRHKLPGIVTDVQEKRGKKSGKSFGIVTIEYGPDQLEFLVFNQKWRSHKFLFKMRTPGIFVLRHTAPTEYGEAYQFDKGHVLKP